MNNVNKTLYIPLYGKSFVSKKGLFLDDKKAEEIWEKEGFSLKGKAKSKWLAYYMGIRSRVFDEWLREELIDNENAVVIHIGCGMDSRSLRVLTKNRKWYDVDFLEVIKERKKYFVETDSYKMICADVRDSKWLFEIKYDGYRMLSFVQNGKVKLLSRNNKDYTKKFTSFVQKSLFL